MTTILPPTTDNPFRDLFEAMLERALSQDCRQ